MGVTMTQTKIREPVHRRIIRRDVVMIVIIAVLGAGLVWLGWALKGASQPDHAVKVTRTFTGTVSIVSEPGNSGCVTPDSGGKDVCSVFALPTGGSIHQGDKVHAAYELVSTGGGNGYYMLLIYPPQSP